jgi:uncharacterized protein YdbL (DUF1318 family)
MKIQTILLRALAVLLLALALPAAALDLGEAKSKGLVGETATGYIAAVKRSPEVDSLVQDINKRRKAQYSKIAKSNGISLEAVEVRAGQKAISRTPAGEFVNRGSGWEKQS